MTTDNKGMTEVATTNELHKLSDLDMTVADRSQDIRGRKVVDSSGEEIGEVEDLFVDDRERKVRFLQVASGGFLGIGETKFMIPVDAIKRIDEGTVHIDQTRERLAKAPKYAPDLVMKQTHWNDLYGYYGYAPFWGPGYIYPPYPFYR
ncbi:MAG: PRC-barrel domain-containing protein [Armatimonadota bacterium]